MTGAVQLSADFVYTTFEQNCFVDWMDGGYCLQSLVPNAVQIPCFIVRNGGPANAIYVPALMVC